MTDENTVYVTQYKGCDIWVERNMGRFTADIEGKPAYHDTLGVMKAAIDKIETRRQKSRALDLPVVLGTGATASITGIHLANGWVTGLGPTSPPHVVYPDVPWIRQAIAERIEHFTQAELLEQKFSFYKILTRRSEYGDYATKLDQLEADYAKAKAAAEREERGA